MRLSANSVWECSCGAFVPMGRLCPKCNKSYAEVLRENSGMRENPDTTKSRKIKKICEPAKKDGFLKSFLFKKKDK